MRRAGIAALFRSIALAFACACSGASSGGGALATADAPPPAVAVAVDAGPADAALESAAPPIDDRDRLAALVADLNAAPADPALRFASFVHDVAYGAAGFPIRARGEITFVYRDDVGGGPLAVAGDFDAWSATAVPMREVAPSLWVATVKDPAPTSRSLYKFVRGGAQFFADPLARRFGYDGNGEHALLEAGTTDGHLERWPAFCDACGALAPRALLAWPPPGYDASSAYPLLVMQDGQNLFDPSGPHGGWRVDTAANDGVRSGALRPFVVVAIPSSAARFAEYTHVTDTLPGVGSVGGKADDYAAFVAKGVVPFARARYHLRTEPAENAILGSSLGGVVSLYVALRHPAIFGVAGAMSPTTSWGSIGQSNPTIASLYAATPPAARVYLDSGGDDGGGCASLSALDSETAHDQFCETRAFEGALLGEGFTLGANLVYAWAPNATHDEAAWAARLPNALATWFPRR